MSLISTFFPRCACDSLEDVEKDSIWMLDILCDDAKNRDISSLFYGMAMKE